MGSSKITMMFFRAAVFFASTLLPQSLQFALRSLEGRTFDLAESKGRVVVMYFGATWCPMADKSIPALQRLADLFPGRDVDFCWVSIDSGRQGEKNYASDVDLRVFAKEMRLSVPVLRDPERDAFRTLGLDVIPTIVIFDRTGQVHFKFTGFNPEQPESFFTVSRVLHQLLM
jgi:thiol-disulfide isomerase/thioredoxin